MANRPRSVRKLTVGSIKDGWHWAVGSVQSIRDNDGYHQVTITTILRHDPTDKEPYMYWDIFVTKEDVSEGEFYWKTHMKGNESVTEEFDLNI